MPRRSPWRIPLLVWALIALGFGAAAWAQVSTTYFLGANYGKKAPSDPLYAENSFDLFYPIGACPLSPGCANVAYPVVVFIRGGNTNAPLPDVNHLSPLCQLMLLQGFVVVIPSYHVIDVDAGDDYLSASRDLGRMIQYLRRFRTILNIDPDRVFALGHSGGGFYAYFLGLNIDYQNLDSRDLVERASSRPNFLVPWGAATQWDCMALDSPLTNPILLEMFQVTAIDDALLLASPVYWLQNPWFYDRSTTPPMCLVYNLSQQTPCGFITDFHDGHFGPLMLSAISRFCGGSGMGQPVCDQSTLVDSSGDVNVTIQNVVAWMVEQAGS